MESLVITTVVVPTDLRKCKHSTRAEVHLELLDKNHWDEFAL